MTFRVFAFLAMLGCFYFSLLEVFFWERATCRRLFGLSIDFSTRTKKFGFVVGFFHFYMGLFLAFGFVYLYKEIQVGLNILTFALSIVSLAGIVFTFAFNFRFFIFLALPAIIGLFFV